MPAVAVRCARVDDREGALDEAREVLPQDRERTSAGSGSSSIIILPIAVHVIAIA
ncbi:hypothetical protein [Sulfitobacter sp. JB4-11]|uniref:hypothetical protein n=1 Tax=Sulfitobacter rhodophyticola TaxID=3238304 RepID=UPI0035193C34